MTFDSRASNGVANDMLHLVMMPTEACKFRCTYSYEDFRLARMQPAVVRGVERLLSRRELDLRRLEIAWFGGEPLLALDIDQRLSRHVCDQQAENPDPRVRVGMKYSSSLETRQNNQPALSPPYNYGSEIHATNSRTTSFVQYCAEGLRGSWLERSALKTAPQKRGG